METAVLLHLHLQVSFLVRYFYLVGTGSSTGFISGCCGTWCISGRSGSTGMSGLGSGNGFWAGGCFTSGFSGCAGISGIFSSVISMVAMLCIILFRFVCIVCMPLNTVPHISCFISHWHNCYTSFTKKIFFS